LKNKITRKISTTAKMTVMAIIFEGVIFLANCPTGFEFEDSAMGLFLFLSGVTGGKNNNILIIFNISDSMIKFTDGQLIVN
jgi:hypothetical protein